ncbi:MAG: NAD(P)H-dependent oxidoreductase [Pseudomonadota bacterium]
MRRIAIIQGHPDDNPARLCNALSEAYAEGARCAGHNVHVVRIATLDFPLLRSQAEWEAGADGTPEALVDVQRVCTRADHFVIIYPLWLGTMPALLKGFLEQTFRPGIALSNEGGSGFPKPAFRGKSARVVVTMGMPAMAYRWVFRAHSLKSLERNILKFAGIKPVRETLFGLVDRAGDERVRSRWLAKMRDLGGRAA